MIEGIIGSLKGSLRDSYQDYANFHIGENAEIWIIGDGATNAKDSGEYISSFCNSLLACLLSWGGRLTVAHVPDAINMIHEKIKRRFICAKGSFLLLFIEKKTDVQHCFYLGDCRVGQVLGGIITWHIQPHSMPLALGACDEHQLCFHPQRHILFRQLTARRLERPDYRQLSLDLSLPVVLATDGFWCNYPAALPGELSSEALSTCLNGQKNASDDMTIVIRRYPNDNGVAFS
ncbi:hypothetical protein [Pantoea coffeiphila]|uniref:Serine/threonine protein phosphatase n=1 Tax=Pantoea coffeiphila TaxID=1465635 RepID=A0A2S9I3V1_9GAMM|nr:hypothetical protein [Pantoea coffeiphila]PRD12470.1 hypothetical protein CQW29_26250 [Pantoea coffeiphila]